MDLKLKFTDKENTAFELTLGESSFRTGLAKLKNLLTGEEKSVELSAVSETLNIKLDSRLLEASCSIH